MRGPGELSGIRQSGELEFSIGDIYEDADILKNAAQAASLAGADDNIVTDGITI